MSLFATGSYLFTWVSEHTRCSVLLALLFHGSLNTCLARLPVQPAWVEWTVALWLVALAVGMIEMPGGVSGQGAQA